MASHLRGARTIVMNVWPVHSSVSKEDFGAICSAMQIAVGASAQPLTLLTVLSVKNGWPYQVEGTVKDPREGIFLLRILQKAINLSRLSIECQEVPALPPMANLKHLSMWMEDAWVSIERINQILLSMPSLETLQLCRHPHHSGTQEDALIVPLWVQHLQLIHVYPLFLKLKSSNTRVTVCGSPRALLYASELWIDVRGQIKGLRISDLDHYTNKYSSKLWDNVDIEVLNFVKQEFN